MARCYDAALARLERSCLAEWRAELIVEARGEVLEIGSGTGANLPYYPSGLSGLTLSEPDRHMRRRLADKLAASGAPFRRVLPCSAAAIDLPDASFDTIVTTLVLCSVPSPPAALANLRRLLKDDGRLLFIEHVAARNDPALLRWQRLIQPLWRPICANCHLTRDTEQEIRAAGFDLVRLAYRRSRGAPAVATPTIIGAARPLPGRSPRLSVAG